MPKSYKLFFEGDPEKKHGYYISSILHGVLMERVEPEYAEKLHESVIHPYSQYVQCRGEKILWVVNCLNSEAEHYIGNAIDQPETGDIFLKHRNETLRFVSKETRETSFQEMVDQYYFRNSDKCLEVSFISPTSFKKDGEYCLFPDVRLIFQSLMRKFDACSENHTVYSDEILEHYEKYARIVGYRLRSTIFHLEGVRIPSFMGGVTIRVNGPQQMVNMAHMLAEFGSYSGVGIKCGIGMGAVQVKYNEP